MKQITLRCVCCKRIRPRNPRVKNQKYWGAKSCQQARKNKWQREKLRTDPDYRADKLDIQQSWRARNSDYWKRYRDKNPDYCERNCRLQRERDKKRCPDSIIPTNDDAYLAKKDTLSQYLDETTTSYYICPVASNLAKRDALEVNIIPISVR